MYLQKALQKVLQMNMIKQNGTEEMTSIVVFGDWCNPTESIIQGDQEKNC